MNRTLRPQHMSATESKSPTIFQRIGKIFVRALIVAAVAVCLGSGLNRSAATLNRDLRPAGFGRGMVHGALMPLALPNLLVGYDVTIYAAMNDGRPYKLGYTLGVNLCGLVFFGLFFWRVKRWAGARR